MKILLTFALIFVFGLGVSGQTNQSKTISKDEYDKIFQFAVSETNADYPIIFKVVTTFFENGKAVSTDTEIVENQSEQYHRNKITIVKSGKATVKYQITAGFGNVFCSNDGVKWKPSQYECRNEVRLYTPRTPESIEYSVTTKTVKGKQFKVYREYSVFPPFEEGQKKDFRQSVSTLDSRGFFISVEDTEGTLNPKIVTLTRKQSWITKANIKPVVAPVK